MLPMRRASAEAWYAALRSLAHAEQRMARVGYAAFPAWLRTRRICDRIVPRVRITRLPRRQALWIWFCDFGTGAGLTTVVWWAAVLGR